MDDCGGRRKQKKRVGKKVSRQDRRMAGGVTFPRSWIYTSDMVGFRVGV